MKRIELLDAWRSLCIFTMVVYHLLVDLSLFGVLPGSITAEPIMLTVRDAGAMSFIFISGISSAFSGNNIRRGIVISAAGLAVVLATYAIGYPVRFGILQCLGVCKLLFGAAQSRLQKISGIWTLTVYIILFFLTMYLTQSVMAESEWLFPFGFKYAGFYSADYFPLFPWCFAFLAGTWVGQRISERSDSLPRLYASVPRALTWPGRHSLIIYLLHQPVLYGACRLLLG